MDLTKYCHEDAVVVDASPETVYALIADVTRVGELSPVCRSARWTDGDRTHFSGDNVMGDRTWTTQCRVDADVPGREFTFTNCGGEGTTELVRWSYTFAPRGDRTEVTEHWQVLPGYEGYVRRLAPDADLEELLDGVVVRTRKSIAQTLANVKRVVER
jgi:hypothetical protein